MEKEDFKIKIFKKKLHFCNPFHSNNEKMMWPTLKKLSGRKVQIWATLIHIPMEKCWNFSNNFAELTDGEKRPFSLFEK